MIRSEWRRRDVRHRRRLELLFRADRALSVLDRKLERPQRRLQVWPGLAGLLEGRALSDVTGALTPTTSERRAAMGLRLALVAIFLLFGAQKFTAAEAMGIVPVVSHSPLTSWLMALGVRNMSRVFGCAELTFGLLLLYGLRRPGSAPAIAGAVGSCITYLTTLSFLFTTPGVFVKGSEPVLSGDVGLFLYKDVVLLAASFVLLAQGLARRGAR